jgi:ribonuclease P protein component
VTSVDQRLRKKERLAGPADFRRCYRHGKRLRNACFTVYAYHRGQAETRLGLAVGKTVGTAVIRNRVKRRLRELFRRHKALLPAGYDLFVRAAPASAAVQYRELENAWFEMMAAVRQEAIRGGGTRGQL